MGPAASWPSRAEVPGRGHVPGEGGTQTSTGAPDLAPRCQPGPARRGWCGCLRLEAGRKAPRGQRCPRALHPHWASRLCPVLSGQLLVHSLTRQWGRTFAWLRAPCVPGGPLLTSPPWRGARGHSGESLPHQQGHCLCPVPSSCLLCPLHLPAQVWPAWFFLSVPRGWVMASP